MINGAAINTSEINSNGITTVLPVYVSINLNAVTGFIVINKLTAVIQQAVFTANSLTAQNALAEFVSVRLTAPLADKDGFVYASLRAAIRMQRPTTTRIVYDNQYTDIA